MAKMQSVLDKVYHVVIETPLLISPQEKNVEIWITETGLNIAHTDINTKQCETRFLDYIGIKFLIHGKKYFEIFDSGLVGLYGKIREKRRFITVLLYGDVYIRIKFDEEREIQHFIQDIKEKQDMVYKSLYESIKCDDLSEKETRNQLIEQFLLERNQLNNKIVRIETEKRDLIRLYEERLWTESASNNGMLQSLSSQLDEKRLRANELEEEVKYLRNENDAMKQQFEKHTKNYFQLLSKKELLEVLLEKNDHIENQNGHILPSTNGDIV